MPTSPSLTSPSPPSPSLPASSHSTPLENLGFDSEGARFELDGQAVRIKKDLDPASVAALRGFYQSALAEFHARPEAPSKPGWFSRLRSWLGRLISPSSTAPAASRAEPPAAGPSASAKSAADPATAPAPADPPIPKTPGPIVRVAEAARLSQPAKRPEVGETPVRSATPDPTLRRVFADRDGVHLIWQTPAAQGPAGQVELHRSLDSDLAQRLQDCYGHLDRLGYKVVGLELLRTAPREPGKSVPEVGFEKSAAHPVAATVPRESGPAAKPTGLAKISADRSAPAKPSAGPEASAPPPPAAADKAAAPAASPVESAGKKERALVMRLHPEILEQPDRALVYPLENSDNKQVLVAPERLLRSLRAAADPARPPAERVTYLRCTAGKNGLKLTDVGLGEGKEPGPARWEEAAKWAEPETEAALRRPKPPSDPELNL